MIEEIKHLEKLIETREGLYCWQATEYFKKILVILKKLDKFEGANK